jgi:hypothetical protein
MLDESLATLETTVAHYHDRGEVSLVAPAAVVLRKLCHETSSQIPLLGQLEQRGVSVPDFLDASPGTLLGFGIRFRIVWPEVEEAIIVSPSLGHETASRPWRDWWRSNALCLPVDPSTGWQAGRLSISRAQLATEWANCYGGAHVDSSGPQQWLIDLVRMQRPGYWTHTLDEDGNPAATLAWFDEPRSPEQKWQPLEVPSQAVAHLVLVRMAAEVIAAYGRPVPNILAGPPRVS